jgi:hypothetical protein
MKFAHLGKFPGMTLVAVLLLVPALSWAQKDHQEKEKEAAPSRHEAAPSRHEAAPHQPKATPEHKGTSRSMGRPAPSSTNRGARSATRPTTTTERGTARTGRGTAPATTGRRTTTTTTTGRRAGRGETTTSTRTRTTTRARPAPRVVHGHTVTYRPSGRVSTIRTAHGATIYHGPHGARMVVRENHGVRTVVVGRRVGYVERPYRGNYRLRTYYFGGHPYAVVYRTRYWGGRPYYWYVPAFYYRPLYYRWVYNPWAVPVVYRWGWFNDPWYPYYGYYFTPYPVYASASLWLTDFILADDLRLAYDAQQQNLAASENVSTTGTVQLSPEVKQLISEEVRQQLAAEQAAAAQPASGGAEAANVPPPALDPAQRVFIVASEMDVTTDDGQECSLTPGDIILRTGDTVVDGTRVEVSIQSSKRGDCPAGANTTMDVADLQEMQNRFREQLDNGLKQLSANQGKNGLPAAPDTSTVAAPGVPTPEPDQDVSDQLQGLQTEADKAEKDINQ